MVRRLAPWTYVSPAYLLIAVFSLVPIAYTAYIAFTNYDLAHFLSYHWVGLTNFVELFAGPWQAVFLPVLVWTLVFASVTTVFNYVAGLGLALLLNNPLLKESTVYRTLLIVPWGLPGTIAILAWQGLLSTSFGQVNAMLHLAGLGPVPWLTNPALAKASMYLVNLWLGFPFFMTACLGGLQSIPGEVYEAANLDGAGAWGTLRRVTMPLMVRFSVPLLISSFAFNFNNFSIVYLLTRGGPPRLSTSFAGSTDVISSLGYNMTAVFQRYNLSAALSVVLFIIVGAITLFQMRLSGQFEEVD